MAEDQTQLTATKACRFVLCCQECPKRVPVTVGHFTELYASIKHLGWLLVPTVHGMIVTGICPTCVEEAVL
jgi:hypothetical protein